MIGGRVAKRATAASSGTDADSAPDVRPAATEGLTTISNVLSGALLDAVIDELALAVVVMDPRRILYENAAARALALRLRREHSTDLSVLLRDHIEATQNNLRQARTVVSLVTAGNGEPFYLHLRGLAVEGLASAVVACIRELAPEREAVKRFYGLSNREAQVVDLVLRGYGNRDIAGALGIAPATAKKHLSSIFNKV